MHSRRKSQRSGFTLVEVLVVLILLALLAAVVVPDVLESVKKGDPTRVAGDVRDIGLGIEMFRLDVKTAFPGDIEDLANLIVAGTDQTITAGAYTTPMVNRWVGPYIGTNLKVTGASAATADSIATGFGAEIINDLDVVVGDSVGSIVTATTCSITGSPAGVKYVAVKITGLDAASFELVNDLIDGTDETDGSGAGGSQLIGNLRFDGTDTFFLATPCRT